MTALLLRLNGPTQSWAGYRVSYTDTPTHPVPTRSAVAGLVAGSLGRRDIAAILDMFTLRVRVDRTNPSLTDQQAAVGPKPWEENAWLRASTLAAGSRFKKPKRSDRRKYDGSYSLVGTDQTGLARRDLVPYAEFVCELTTPAAHDWHAALRDPVFPPYLGRSSNPPTWPFVLGVHTHDGTDPFHTLPRVRRHDEHGTGADTTNPGVRVYTITGDYHQHRHTPDALATPPAVRTREEQMQWVSQHLTR